MKRTGHRSVAGVRRYNKPINEMLVDISNKLNPPESTEQVKINHQQKRFYMTQLTQVMTNPKTTNQPL
jgi:hypothetical protein